MREVFFSLPFCHSPFREVDHHPTWPSLLLLRLPSPLSEHGFIDFCGAKFITIDWACRASLISNSAAAGIVEALLTMPESNLWKPLASHFGRYLSSSFGHILVIIEIARFYDALALGSIMYTL